MVTDASDKLLVASVLERGERDMDGDVVQPEQEDVIGAPLDVDAAAELGVQVSVEESQEQPWQEPPAKLEGGRALDPGRAGRHGPGHGRHR